MGAINGLFQTGGLFGTLSCITTADKFGRRMAMLIACIFSIVGGGLQAGSVNIGMYIVMRFITGIGIGKRRCLLMRVLFTAHVLCRCTGDLSSPLSKRDCTTSYQGTSGGDAWSNDLCRIHLCELDRSRVLLCSGFGCPVAHSPGDSMRPSVDSGYWSYVSPRIPSMA
jgi:hypothetical protein